MNGEIRREPELETRLVVSVVTIFTYLRPRLRAMGVNKIAITFLFWFEKID
jgi:hypothetical protein